MAHVTIIGTVTAKPETRDELQALLSAQVAATRAEPGEHRLIWTCIWSCPTLRRCFLSLIGCWPGRLISGL
jgi:hypothetical protein